MSIGQRYHSRLAAYPVRKAVLFITAVVVALQLALSLFAWMLAQHEIVPMLEQKAYATGLAEARRLTRKLASGIEFEQLEGVQGQFDATLRSNPDLAYIILTDSAGRIVVRSGSGGEVFTPERYSAVTREIERKLVTYGQVHVGIDRQFIVARMKAVRADAVAVLLAMLLATTGLAAYAAQQAFGRPVAEVAQVLARMAAGDFRFRTGHTTPALERAVANAVEKVNLAYAALQQMWPLQARSARALAAWERLRANHQFADGAAERPAMAADQATPALLCFLCLLTETLTRTTLAHYAADLAAFRAAAAPVLRAALPAAALYLAMALALPLARNWVARAGNAASFAAGSLLLMLGCGAAALVDDYVTLAVGRCVAGIGMALALSACLGAARQAGERRSGASALAILAAAGLAAEAAGAPLGGIIGKLGGMQAVWMVCALLAACSAVIGHRLLGAHGEQAVRRTQRAIGSSAARPPHWAPHTTLLLCAQLPAAAAAGAFPAILLPLALHRAGYDPAQAGRYGLLLALLLVAATPLFLRLAYRSNRYALVAIIGAGLAGSGIAPLSLEAIGPDSTATSLALLGCGMLLIFGTCLVLAQRAVRAAEFRLGALQSWQWGPAAACLCAAAGAMAAGAGAHAYGPAVAAAASGSLSLMAGAGFMLVYLLVVVLPWPRGSGTIRPT